MRPETFFRGLLCMLVMNQYSVCHDTLTRSFKSRTRLPDLFHGQAIKECTSLAHRADQLQHRD
jgi:hypothetical protein